MTGNPRRLDGAVSSLLNAVKHLYGDSPFLTVVAVLAGFAILYLLSTATHRKVRGGHERGKSHATKVGPTICSRFIKKHAYICSHGQLALA